MPFNLGNNVDREIPDAKARKRAWRFTIFDSDLLEQGAALFKEIPCAYCVVGDEICPSTKKRHFQGYIRFKDAKTAWAVDKLFDGKAWWGWATAKNCDESNTKYCSKDGKLVYRAGDMPQQGMRTDLHAVREMIAEGKSMGEMIDDPRSSGAALRTAAIVLAYKEKKRTWEPHVTWIWGPAGSGKSTYAKRALPGAYLIENKGRAEGTKWWQGYDAHEDVIIDDFRGNFCPFTELLGILGPSAFVVENKGGSRQLLAKRIIVTSALPPEGCYDATRLGTEKMDQLLRRINIVAELPRLPNVSARQPMRVTLDAHAMPAEGFYASLEGSSNLCVTQKSDTPNEAAGSNGENLGELCCTKVGVINRSLAGLQPALPGSPDLIYIPAECDALLDELLEDFVEPDG